MPSKVIPSRHRPAAPRVRLLAAMLLCAAPAFGAELRVASFGAAGDGRTDDGPAIQRALDAAIASGRGARVIFEAGRTYRLGAQGDRLAILEIGRARGLTVEGRGATIVAHPSNRILTVFDSEDIALRELTLDYDPLPFTQARLTAILPAGKSFRFKVEPGYSPPAVGDEGVYRDFKSSDAVFIQSGTRKFTHGWGRLRSVREVGAGVYEAVFHQSDFARRLEGVAEGDFIAVKLPFPEARPRRDPDGRHLSSSASNIYVAYSRRVRMERIFSHAAPAMTFVSSASEGIVLDRCQVVRRPGTDRLVAGNSDGAHFKSLTILPEVRECVFEALMDDSINIKISSEMIAEVDGRRLRLRHGDIIVDGAVIEPGQSLLLLGGGGRRHLGFRRVLAVERLNYRELWVTLEAPVEGLVPGDLAFLRPVNEARVIGCEFRSQLKTALLVYPPALISDCRFSDVAYGVHSPFPGRIEGPPPSQLRIFRCEFNRPGVAAIALHLPAAEAGAPDRQALVLEQSRISLGSRRGTALNAYHQNGILLRDVSIASEDNRPRAELLRLRECTNVIVEP